MRICNCHFEDVCGAILDGMQDWLTYKSEAQNFVKRVKDYLLCIEVTEERVVNDAAGKRGDDTGEPS